MPFADDLLEQARHLANREPKRPRRASLRRAAERPIVARMLDHARMEQVCKNKRNDLSEYFKARPPASRQREVAEHLHVITQAFVIMLEHRHAADYDNARKWTRTDTLEKIESVEAAFLSWRKIREEDDTQNFLATLLLKGRR